MDNLEKYITKSQHSYIICGDFNEIKDSMVLFLRKFFNIEIDGNPDYRESKFDVFGIDEARILKEDQGRVAFSGELKIFVILANSITREAQNALLKVFEEPTEGTYIFLVVKNVRQILPTLLSRVRVIRIESGKQKVESRNDAKEFLETSIEKRLRLPIVKKIIEDKDKQALVSFFDELETFLHKNLPVQKMDDTTRAFLGELIKFRNYAGDRSSSVKMLIEHISIIAPVI